MHKYETILYWSNEDRAFVAEVPELPGCMSHKTTTKAKMNSLVLARNTFDGKWNCKR